MKSIITDERRCFICGRIGTLQTHHMLHGSRRKAADLFGLTVPLCPRCHRRLHDLGEHDLELEALAQERFEEIYGHAEWMRVFGKNYRR